MSDIIEGYSANSTGTGEPEYYSSMVRYRAEPTDLWAKDRI
jgi:hypothetical protein